MIVIVMGVSGCGKSSVGRAIADDTGWPLIEGDDLHPSANREKMSAGTPLDDQDRGPWLDAIAAAAADTEVTTGNVIVTCSALKRIYRDRLRQAGSDVRFVHLAGTSDRIQQRLDGRRGHFMPPDLLASQLAALEPPDLDETAIRCDIDCPIPEIASSAIAKLRNAN